MTTAAPATTRGHHLRRSSAWGTVALTVAVLLLGLLARRAFPGPDVVAGVAMAGALAVIAVSRRVSLRDLGLVPSSWRRGLLWGGALAAAAGVAYAVLLVIPATRDSIATGGGAQGRALWVAVLLVIPLGTVLPEELAFRGLLLHQLALLGHRLDLRAGVALSSAAFGLWHVLPALAGGAANAAVDDVLGGGVAGTVLRVLVTVAFTAVAGVVLGVVRLRSRSLVAPMMAHWAVNGFGATVVAVAAGAV